MTDFAVWYNGHVLHDEVKYFSVVKYLENKEVLLEDDMLDNEDGVFYDIRSGVRSIEITGTIKTEDRGHLLQEIDLLKSKVLEPKKLLIIKEGSQQRQALAVCKKVSLGENHFNIEWIDFVLTFYTYDYMQDSTQVSDNFTVSSSPFSWNISRLGTANAKAIVAVTFSAASGVNSLALSIDGVSVTVTGAISAGDTILIDGTEKTIKKNGAIVGFFGIIPKIKSSTAVATLTVNGTFTASVLYQYHPAWK